MYEDPIQTKIRIPPLRDQLVDRPRLAQRLNAGKNIKLTLIRAPAGFGKTTLLSKWAWNTPHNIAWFSVNREDNDPLIFWTYVVAAIRNACPEIGVSTMKMLQSIAGLPARVIVKTLVNDIFDKRQPVILVIDDFHLIDDDAVQGSLKFFLDCMPEETHLVISSRRELPFPTGRLKIKGQFDEIDVDDLRFTSSEAILFARQVIGKDMGDNEIAILAKLCEGWAAGLQIAALAARKHKGEAPTALPQMKHDIIDYFMEEVFAFQPAHIQAFLLETSILERMNAPLCNEVTGRKDGKVLLEALCRANMFVIALDKKANWYRYHHMFTEALSDRLSMEHPDQLSILHGRAANWFRNNRMPNEAIHHAVVAKNWDLAGELISKYAGIAILRGDLATSLRWIRALPKNRVSDNPFLCISYAWALFLTHLSRFSTMPFFAIEQLLSDASKFYPELRHSEPAENSVSKLLTAHVDALRVHLAYSRNEPRENVIELGIRTLEKFDDSKNNLFIRTNTLFTLALTYLDTGELDACSACLEEARSAAFIGAVCFQVVLTDSFRIFLARIRGKLRASEQIRSSGLQSVRASFLETERIAPEMLGYYELHKAHALYEKNKIADAADLIEKAMPSVTLLEETYGLLFGYELQFYIRLFQGAGEKEVLFPLRKIEKLSVFCPRARSFSGALRIRYLLCRFNGSGETLRRAFAVADECGVRLSETVQDGENPYPVPFENKIRITEQLCLMRLYTADWRNRGETQARMSMQSIVDAFETILVKIRQMGLGEMEIEALILFSLAQDAWGNEQEAQNLLKQAIDIAGPEGYLRIFVNEGKEMANLFEKCIRDGQGIGYAQRALAVIRENFSDPAASFPSPERLSRAFENPLSKQERAILELISRGFSNQEIATELYVAVATVKTHNYNIFKKLGVSSRTAAINEYRDRIKKLDINVRLTC